MGQRSRKYRSRGNDVLETATWWARWIAIIVFLVTFPFKLYGTPLIYALVAFAVIYNLLRYFLKVRDRPRLRSPYLMLFIDYVFLAWLMFMTGGVYSPYILYMALPLLSAVYIRRSTGAAPILILLAANGIILFGCSLFQRDLQIEYGAFRTTCIYIFTFIFTAYMADRLTESQRAERNYALDVQYQAVSERSRLITLINSIAEVVLAIDERGTVTLHNAAALDMMGVHDLAGRKIHSVFNLVDENENPVDILVVARSSKTTLRRNDLRFRNPNDNTLINLDISIAPVKAPYTEGNNNTSAYIMVMRDITKTKDLEQQRDEFLSVITHELRTPVATAEAGISILLTPKLSNLDPNLKRYAVLAHDSIVFLAELINDLASISKLERGIYRIVPEPLDAKAMVESVVHDNQAAANTKKLKLIAKPIGELPAILTSQHEVREILQNLVTNAIKYTQKGSITIDVQAMDDPRQGIVISVKDTGIGIAATDKPHLFEKFYRSEDYRTRTAGGTGLGLYITEKLAERLNAKIWFTSKLNHGSTFYLAIPPFSKLQQDERKVIDAQMDNIITNI